MMLTQPSLQDSTKSDINACMIENRKSERHAVSHSVRAAAKPRRVTNLPQVVKVVFPSNPAITRLQTLGFVGDVSDVKPLAVKELPFEQLHKRTDEDKDKNVSL